MDDALSKALLSQALLEPGVTQAYMRKIQLDMIKQQDKNRQSDSGLYGVEQTLLRNRSIRTATPRLPPVPKAVDIVAPREGLGGLRIGH